MSKIFLVDSLAFIFQMSPFESPHDKVPTGSLRWLFCLASQDFCDCHNQLHAWCIITGMDERFQSPMWICYCTTTNWVIPSAPVSAWDWSHASISECLSISLSFKAAEKAFKTIFSYTPIWKIVPNYYQAVAEMIILYSATFNEINYPSLQELLTSVLLEQ